MLAALPLANAHTLVSKEFFPSLIAGPFKDGIVDVLIFASAMCLVAALASWMRGGKFVHEEAHDGPRPPPRRAQRHRGASRGRVAGLTRSRRRARGLL